MKYVVLMSLSFTLFHLNAQEKFPFIQPVSVEVAHIGISKPTPKAELVQEEITESPQEQIVTAPTQELREDTSDIVTLEIQFEKAKFDIPTDSLLKIEEFADSLQEDPESQVIVYGYTGSIHDTLANKRLSQKRAEAVMDVLINFGVKLTRLTAIGMGIKNPIADNTSSRGRAKNRRIEVEILR